VLQYAYVPDILTLRKQHIEFVSQYTKKGILLMGGAFDPPSDGALIVLSAENFVRSLQSFISE